MDRTCWIKLLPFLVVVLVCSGCGDHCQVTTTYTYYEPVYSTAADIKNAVTYQPPQALSNLGKIYVKDGWIFINEVDKGIHVIDNSNPSAPIPTGFLKIPGNRDLAIVDHYLYADSYIDLVVFDIADKQSIREIDRLNSVFGQLQSYGYQLLSNGSILTEWRQKSTVEVNDMKCGNVPQRWPWGGIYYADGIAYLSSAKMGPVLSSSSGVGGSTATFTIAGNRLYALNGSRMEIFDVSVPSTIKKGTGMQIGFDVETLFPAGQNLFAGSQSGMYIYDLSNADAPKQVSKYEHVRSCDPVVVDERYAYVTLRNGNTCQGFSNQLEVISLENLASPRLMNTYPMTNPFGLGVDEGILFICDGTDGLKVFDATDVTKIDLNMLGKFSASATRDVIPLGGIAMMISSDGLYQFDYSDPHHIRQISKLPIIH